MKAIILGLLVLTLSVSAHADAEKREYTKTSSTTATVKITTEETDGTQAAVYVDGQENQRFINDLLKDSTSPLATLVKQIELENCEENSTPEANGWIDGCGEVTITESVTTSYGRGGWMGAGAGHTYFVGFTSDGTGHFFDVTHMVTLSESVEAETNADGDYAGVLIKTLTLGKIVKVPDMQ